MKIARELRVLKWMHGITMALLIALLVRVCTH
jgi:hypothetical protein